MIISINWYQYHVFVQGPTDKNMQTLFTIILIKNDLKDYAFRVGKKREQSSSNNTIILVANMIAMFLSPLY